jgi:ornithine carbamoyltransferase
VKRSLLTLADLSDIETRALSDLAIEMARAPVAARYALRGKVVGLLFTAPSTRTRTAFWRAALDMSAQVMLFSGTDLQTNTGESFEDTGRILVNIADLLVVRTNGPNYELQQLAVRHPAVINAMSALEHPTQAIGDAAAIAEHFGGRYNIRLSYFGEGNNTAAALALCFSAQPGAILRFYTPPGYGLSPAVFQIARARATRCGALILEEHVIPPDLPRADVVYTTRWQTMGQPHSDPSWRRAFEPFQVNEPLFERVAEASTVFMHDLPAVRGEETTGTILDGPRSIAWRQATHKITGAKATLLWCLGKPKLSSI